MGSAADEQANLERDVGEALAGGQFALAYQPVCDAESRTIQGFEALIRWCHPIRGQVPPSLFIPAAERAGLILQIGNWVIETACAEAASWSRPLRIAVNVSPPQFMQPDLCQSLQRVLERTGLDPTRLDIEVTEGLMLGEAEVVLQNMRCLRSMGIKISLDDFGTGHSSLSYLCRFPFDTIKIDRSFVQNLGDDTESRAIVSSIISLSRNLRLNVVAEGVETELQLRELRDLRCSRIQGYLFGRPMPPEQVRALASDGDARRGAWNLS
jgi:EAL domain-containing protein (putative c-di-GMP-specific phosphodiesterase class I)